MILDFGNSCYPGIVPLIWHECCYKILTMNMFQWFEAVLDSRKGVQPVKQFYSSNLQTDLYQVQQQLSTSQVQAH